MEEEIEKLIKDCQHVISHKEGMDDPYSQGSVDSTKAIIMRLELIIKDKK